MVASVRNSVSGQTAAFAPLTGKTRGNLPTRSFAYVDQNGNGHLPLNDAAHVRNALARFNQTEFPSETAAKSAWSKILAAAKRYGIKHADAMPVAKIGRSAAVAGAEHRTAIATVSVALKGDEPPEWVELVPLGEFSGRDGRGPFRNDQPAAVIKATAALEMSAGLPLDYDHATDFAAPEGRPAPAAAWIRELAIRDNAICGRIEWTAAGAAAVKAKEYRYISPVFEYSPDGEVVRILRAALTNNPNLNLPAIAAARGLTLDEPPTGANESTVRPGEPAPQAGSRAALAMRCVAKMKLTPREKEVVLAVMAKKPKALHEVVKALQEVLPNTHPHKILEMAKQACGEDGAGGEMDAEDGDPFIGDESEEQMTARHEAEMAEARDQAASAAELAELRRRHGEELEERRAWTAARVADSFGRFASGSANVAAAAPARMSQAELDTMIAKSGLVVALQRENSQLRAAHAHQTATAKVDEAIKTGKLVPAQRDWAIAYCSADTAGFDRFIGAQPTILAAGSDHTISAMPAGAGPEARLPGAALAICSALSIKPEDFVKAQQTRANADARLV